MGSELGRARRNAWPRSHSRRGDSAAPMDRSWAARAREACARGHRPPYGESLCSSYECAAAARRRDRPSSCDNAPRTRPRPRSLRLAHTPFDTDSKAYLSRRHREIRRDAVLWRGEMGEANAIRANLLKNTAARRTIANADRILASGNSRYGALPLSSGKSLYQCPRKLQKDGADGAHATSHGKYRDQAAEDWHISI